MKYTDVNYAYLSAVNMHQQWTKKQHENKNKSNQISVKDTKYVLHVHVLHWNNSAKRLQLIPDSFWTKGSFHSNKLNSHPAQYILVSSKVFVLYPRFCPQLNCRLRLQFEFCKTPSPPYFQNACLHAEQDSTRAFTSCSLHCPYISTCINFLFDNK